MSSATPARLLTIAGSDSGGGAGIQADLKTFAALGAHGMSVVTAVTAQNTLEVRAVQEIEPDVVAAQIDAVFDDIGVDAIKIGMLASPRIVEVVAERLASRPPCPLVLDPVMVSKSGAFLLSDDAIEVLLKRLLPRATLVTPNLPEAERLTGLPVESERQRREAAIALAEIASSALIKGGHDDAADPVLDLLFDGRRFTRFERPRIATRATHGTGCTLSSAIAVGLGMGWGLIESVEAAGDYLHGALRRAFPLGKGQGPVHHFHAGARWRQTRRSDD